MHPDDVQSLQHLNRCDRDGLVAFLTGEREDKIAIWNGWRQCRITRPSI